MRTYIRFSLSFINVWIFDNEEILAFDFIFEFRDFACENLLIVEINESWSQRNSKLNQATQQLFLVNFCEDFIEICHKYKDYFVRDKCVHFDEIHFKWEIVLFYWFKDI